MVESGYDGVVVESDVGSNGKSTKTYVVFDSSQMKSTDTVTYDDNGNEIPLSARFDSSKKDIRYSLPERNQATVDGRQSQGYNKENKNQDNGGKDNGSTNAELLAGREVSAARGSGDGIRQQSENSRKLDDFLRDNEGSQNVNRQRTAGASGWAHKSSDGTSRFEVGHRKGFLRSLRKKSLKSVDSADRILSEPLMNRLKYTALKDEDGTILSLYHFTDVVFDVFKNGDIGFHFGTIDAAHKRHIDPARTKRGNETIYKEVYIDMHNPVEIDGDRGVWDPFVTSYFLWDQGIFTEGEVNSLKELDGYVRGRYDSEACVKLRELLKEKGYDGIVYSNGVEGDISVIAFDADQIITVAENGVLKENSGVSYGDSKTKRYSLPEHPTPLQVGDAYKNGEITREEYVDRINELWEETGKAEGTIKLGEIVEPPNKRVPTPKSVSNGTKVRQFARTILESGYATPEMEAYLKELVLEGDFSYTPTSNEKTLEKARKNIESQGYGNAKDNWQRAIV